MAKSNQTKAERREARAAGTTKAERREARGGKAKPKRDRKPGRDAPAAGGAPAEDASLDERIDWRLSRIEEAVAKQSEQSAELLQRVTDLLQDSTAGSD